MPNTAKMPGKNDIKTFAKTAYILNVLNIHDETSHQKAVDLAEFVLDEINDDPHHALNTFLDLLTDAIERYENKIYGIPKASPVEVLKFLMDQHNLTQKDLSEELGGQSIVSEILNQKRKLNLNQIYALADKFKIDPSVFLEPRPNAA